MTHLIDIIGWRAATVLLQREKEHLDHEHHQFIDDMVSRTARGLELSRYQQKYLHQLVSQREAQITNVHNLDGQSELSAVALFVYCNKDQLDPRCHEYVDSMVSYMAAGGTLREIERDNLYKFFHKVGGKITRQ
jgi:hypothetical protein